MTIKVQWDNQQNTIIRYIFEGVWDWADFEIAVKQGFDLSEDMSQQVDVIFDLTDSASLPNGALIYLKKFMKVIPLNHNHHIVVGESAELVIIVDMFNRIFKKCKNGIIHSNSLAKARTYLAYLQAEARQMVS